MMLLLNNAVITKAPFFNNQAAISKPFSLVFTRLSIGTIMDLFTYY